MCANPPQDLVYEYVANLVWDNAVQAHKDAVHSIYPKLTVFQDFPSILLPIYEPATISLCTKNFYFQINFLELSNYGNKRH
jgi:hypothetical protein